MNFGELLERAQEGTLAPDVVRQVGDQLRENPDMPDAYKAIYILGATDAIGYRDVVETFLDEPDDPMLARIALQVLLNDWGFGDEYRDELGEFVGGVDWDDEDDVRHVALSAAGERVRDPGDPELLAQLLKIAEDDDEDQLTRDIAFDAIARGLGLGYDELRTRSRLPSDDPWATSLLERARELAAG